MKRFVFPLEKVLSFRQRELELAESRLRQIQTQQAYLERRARSLHEQSLTLRGRTAHSSTTSGAALAATQNYVDSLQNEQLRAVESGRKLESEKQTQLQMLLGKRREVKVLERLKERRKKAYRTARARKQELEAADWFLARSIGRGRS